MTKITSGGYDEAVKERVFLVWLLDADRNFARTVRILADRYPNEPTPSDQSIRNWHAAEDWDTKAQEYFATTGSFWQSRFQGRLIAQYDRLLTWQDALIDPDHPDFARWFGETSQDTLTKMREKRLSEVEKTLGVGQHGQKVARFEIPLPHSAGQTDGSPEEVAARFRERQLKSGERE
jgi:hypothetical protein